MARQERVWQEGGMGKKKALSLKLRDKALIF
jgi:hypothetical protein